MRGSEKFSAMTKYRNGVEALPSLLRRKYKVDQMPVRGKKLTKLYLTEKLNLTF